MLKFSDHELFDGEGSSSVSLHSDSSACTTALWAAPESSRQTDFWEFFEA